MSCTRVTALLLFLLAGPGCETVDEFLAEFEELIETDDLHHAAAYAAVQEAEATQADLDTSLAPASELAEPPRCAALRAVLGDTEAALDDVDRDTEHPLARPAFVDDDLDQRFEDKDRAISYRAAQAQYAGCVAADYIPVEDGGPQPSIEGDERTSATLDRYMAAGAPAQLSGMRRLEVGSRLYLPPRQEGGEVLDRGGEPGLEELLHGVSLLSVDQATETVMEMVCPKLVIDGEGENTWGYAKCLVQRTGGVDGNDISRPVAIVRMAVRIPEGRDPVTQEVVVRSDDALSFPAPDGVTLEATTQRLEGDAVRVDLTGGTFAEKFLDCASCATSGQLRFQAPPPPPEEGR